MHPLVLVEIVLLLTGLTVVAVAIPLDSRATAGFGLTLLGIAGGSRLWLALSDRDRHWSLCDIQAGSLLVSYFAGGAITLMLSETGFIRGLHVADLATLLNAVELFQ